MKRIVLLGGLILGAGLFAQTSASLEQEFRHPPAAARPWVYWYFMDGNMSREGLTADLEAMQQAGIGGAIFLEVDLGLPRGPVEFMSPAWRELFAHAVREAERLGIEIAVGSGPGWCGTGGPWVKPEQSMQHLLASETSVAGPFRFNRVLPRPRALTPFFGEKTLTPELAKQWHDYYRDVAVLAFPAPRSQLHVPDIEGKALYQRAPFSSRRGTKPFFPTAAEYPATHAGEAVARDGVLNLTSQMTSDGRLDWEVPPGEWTILRFVRTATGQTTRPAPAAGLGFESDKFDPAAIEDHFAHYPGPLLKNLGPDPKSGPGLTTLHFDSWEMSAQNWSADFRADFQRLRGYDPLRFLPAMTGRVVDTEEMTERFLWDLRQTAQELVIANHATRLKALGRLHGLSFSIEPYDMNPTADLSLGAVADVPMGEFWWEGRDTRPGIDNVVATYSVIEAASIAHTGGKNLVGAEAFTSKPGEDWRAHPGNMKAMGDWAFCAGVNRLAIHRYQHQPWLDRWPGMRMREYGVHWERTQTWWPLASAYHEYLSRCQFMLRQGLPVADILYLAREGAPLVFRSPPSATVGESAPDRRGYNFDGCAPETLRERVRVQDGKLLLPDGMSYRVLVLPECETMTVGLLRSVKSLVQAGATVIGPRPVKSPGLSGFPECDAEVSRLAAEIWGLCDGRKIKEHALGQGRVVWEAAAAPGDENPYEQYADYAVAARVLAELGVSPDFESDGPVRYTHRCVDGGDVYFVANREARAVEALCDFRNTDGTPELWDPLTGERRALPEFTHLPDGRTRVPLRFAPEQSFFIVFRDHDGERSGGRNFPTLRPLLQLSGPWEVAFDPKWGGPEKITFDRLEDWTLRPEPGIKYYSGRAIYRKHFELAPEVAGTGRRLLLDLGTVSNLAQVRLNGRDLGAVWCAPWRVDISTAVRSGANELEITVANLWPNRLIGDQGLPAEQRRTWTTLNPFKPDTTLLESGLLGPVTLQLEIE